MASVWTLKRDGKGRVVDHKLRGHMAAEDALRYFRRLVKGMADTGAKVTVDGLHATAITKSGKRSIVWVEPLSPPSAPEPGQPLRRNGKMVLST